MVIVAIAFFFTPVWWSGVVLIGAAMVVVLFRRIDVEVTRRELVIRYGAPWSWPQRVPRKRIESVAVTTVRPLHWGGWGYRGALRVFRRAAVLLRAGEALEVRLDGGRRILYVTIDDAAGAVAALEA